MSKGADDSLLNEYELPPSKGIALPPDNIGLDVHTAKMKAAVDASDPVKLDPAERLRPM